MIGIHRGIHTNSNKNLVETLRFLFAKMHPQIDLKPLFFVEHLLKDCH